MKIKKEKTRKKKQPVYRTVGVIVPDKLWEIFLRLRDEFEVPAELLAVVKPTVGMLWSLLIDNMIALYTSRLYKETGFNIDGKIVYCECGHNRKPQQRIERSSQPIRNLYGLGVDVKKRLFELEEYRSCVSRATLFRAMILTYDAYKQGKSITFCDTCGQDVLHRTPTV